MRRVVEFGDGWLAVPKSVEAFEESLGALKIAADKAGRAMSDIPITISPMYVDSVDSYAEEYKHYSGMGYDSFFDLELPVILEATRNPVHIRGAPFVGRVRIDRQFKVKEPRPTFSQR